MRTASPRRLAAMVAAAIMLAVSAGIAQAALTGSGPTPAPKALDRAVYDAAHAPAVDGITARVTFTNRLLPSGALPEGTASPLTTGASGRLWLTGDGRLRVELQSPSGDAQIVADGTRFSVYDAASNTVYKGLLPDDMARGASGDRHHGSSVTLDAIRRGLDRLAQRWTLSGAQPTSTAGRPTYTVRMSPKDQGGLLGTAELAWDADNGVPLRAAVFARGQADPVVELRTTDVSYGPVAAGDVTPTAPPGARVVDLGPAGSSGGGGRTGATRTFGEGLGKIVVFQRRARAGQGSGPSGHDAVRLPRIDVNGAAGTELATALGTVVTFERGGASYVVAGLVPRTAVESAARSLP
jgi:outer membrane lipoprotein-sorting protein